jgi:alpha-beta hydrolase superfamily lysophospholipase
MSSASAALLGNAEVIVGTTFNTASGAESAFYFGTDRDLFGWLHMPRGPICSDVGLVICQPFGYEAICSHRSIRTFAEEAAALGIPALRFDYGGVGDSGDIEPNAGQIELWVEDIVTAVTEVRRRAGVNRVILLGLRLGATLATLALAKSKDVHGLILIAPIVTGRKYLRQIRTSRLAAAVSGSGSGPAPLKDLGGNKDSVGGVEVNGFWLSGASVGALSGLDLASLDVPAADGLLIIDDDQLPTANAWHEALCARGTSSQYVRLRGSVAMLTTDPQFAATPQAILDSSREWLRERGMTRESPDRYRPSRALQILPSTRVLELPGPESDPTATLTERPVIIPAEVDLFGIVTEPCSTEKRRRVVILLNVGAEHHIGSNRMYVSLARRWARRGYTVLRLDLAGLGDSESRNRPQDNKVFPEAALLDVKAAIDYMSSTYQPRDITLCGLCSGAYHSFRAATGGGPVNRVLAVNPMTFYWNEGMTAENLQESVDVARNLRFYYDRLLSGSIWKRIFTGGINPWRVARIFLHRPLLAMECRIRNVARRLQIRLPRDLGWELQDLMTRGVRTVFIFSQGEPGIDLLRIQAGSAVGRPEKPCIVHIIDSADHIFSQRESRAVLERILTSELLARVSRAT